MKIYIPIIIMLFLGCKSVKTKTSSTVSTSSLKVSKYQKLNTFKDTSNDTLAYMRSSIIGRKTQYIGKNLDVLLNDLELQVKTYLTGSSNLVGISPSLTLEFYPRNTIEIKKMNRIDPVILVIVWETPLPKDVVIPLVLKNKGVWTDETKKYFGKQKVRDVLLVDYKFQ